MKNLLRCLPFTMAFFCISIATTSFAKTWKWARETMYADTESGGTFNYAYCGRPV